MIYLGAYILTCESNGMECKHYGIFFLVLSNICPRKSAVAKASPFCALLILLSEGILLHSFVSVEIFKLLIFNLVNYKQCRKRATRINLMDL